MSYSARFERFDSLVAAFEGGISRDPRDPGGETAFGISRASYPSEEPWPPSRERAQYLRHRDYWERARCDELPEMVALAVYDWSIHAGEDDPARALQFRLGVVSDGDIGPRTVAAAVSYCSTPERELELTRTLIEARGQSLGQLVHRNVSLTAFAAGWWLRTLRLLSAVEDLYTSRIDSEPDLAAHAATKEEAMSAPIVGGESEPKPLQYSRRVWAAIIGFIPTIVTVLTGFGITLPLPAGAIEGLDGVVQSLFGLATAALALWSKFRPDPVA